MKAELTDASLTRYAGRFVWLELDFDRPVNQPFIAQHAVMYTPTLLVLDPADERATAAQLGGLTLPELTRFLERGEQGVMAKATTPAAAALARGDAFLGRGQRPEAIAAFRDALRLGSKSWPERDRAVASLTWSLQSNGEREQCAQTAVTEAPHMARGEVFSRVVLAGIACADASSPAQKVLESLAAEAIALPSTLRDHRFQLYQQLMVVALRRDDHATAKRWGDRWLAELDATKPANDDERSALDVARVDAASILDEPARVIPALTASERTMPNNYNASLRLAQIETEAKHYDEAVAACDRGLTHVTGPLGRSWLLQTKAEALSGKGDRAGARRTLEESLRAAKEIGGQQMRESNVKRISRAIKDLG
jgi:predicted negative regulator of RcsB-dependent stress response